MTDAFGGCGGIAQYNRDLLTALGETDYISEAVVLPRCAAEKKIVLPPKIKQLKPILNPLIYSMRAMLFALRQGPFDLILCGHLRMASLGWFLSALIGKPYWIQVYGTEAWQKGHTAGSFFVEKAALILSISRFTKKMLQQWVCLEPHKVKVLPCAVDENIFRPGPRSELMLERWGLKGFQVLLTVSRMDASERYKGHELVIKAMPELLKKHPNLRYVIAGTGNDMSFLKHSAATLGVTKEIIFLGQVEESLKPELYRSADVFVMPSKKEGFGIVFLEALACGIPVVAGNKDGSIDPLCDGAMGRLVDPDNLQEIINAIEDQLLRTENKNEPVLKFSFSSFKKHLLSILNLDFKAQNLIRSRE